MLTAQDKRKIITTEIRCVRRIINIINSDKIRNDRHSKACSNTNVTLHLETSQMVQPCLKAIAGQYITETIILRISGAVTEAALVKRWLEEVTDILLIPLHGAHQQVLSRNLFAPSTSQDI